MILTAAELVFADDTGHPRHPVYEGLTPRAWYKANHSRLFLPEAELLARKTPYPSEISCEAGVYFLWQDDDLIYVGRAVNPSERLRAHYRAGREWFNYVTVVQAPMLAYKHLEVDYIAALKPPLNRTYANVRYRKP